MKTIVSIVLLHQRG